MAIGKTIATVKEKKEEAIREENVIPVAFATFFAVVIIDNENANKSQDLLAFDFFKNLVNEVFCSKNIIEQNAKDIILKIIAKRITFI